MTRHSLSKMLYHMVRHSLVNIHCIARRLHFTCKRVKLESQNYFGPGYEYKQQEIMSGYDILPTLNILHVSVSLIKLTWVRSSAHWYRFKIWNGCQAKETCKMWSVCGAPGMWLGATSLLHVHGVLQAMQVVCMQQVSCIVLS